MLQLSFADEDQNFYGSRTRIIGTESDLFNKFTKEYAVYKPLEWVLDNQLMESPDELTKYRIVSGVYKNVDGINNFTVEENPEVYYFETANGARLMLELLDSINNNIRGITKEALSMFDMGQKMLAEAMAHGHTAEHYNGNKK